MEYDSRWTEERGRRVIRQWRRSGQSLAGFAREYGWKVERLRYWRDRISEVDGVDAERGREETRLVPGVVVEGGPGPRVRVMMPRGVVVEAEMLLTAEWVAALAGALGDE